MVTIPDCFSVYFKKPMKNEDKMKFSCRFFFDQNGNSMKTRLYDAKHSSNEIIYAFFKLRRIWNDSISYALYPANYRLAYYWTLFKTWLILHSCQIRLIFYISKTIILFWQTLIVENRYLSTKSDNQYTIKEIRTTSAKQTEKSFVFFCHYVI